MATAAQSYAAVGAGPIPFCDGTTGQQICVPLAAITFSDGAPVLPFPSTDPKAIWIGYLVNIGAIQPGPPIPSSTNGATGPAPSGVTVGATAAPTAGGPTGAGATAGTTAAASTSTSGPTGP
jgi:hypothetical protein